MSGILPEPKLIGPKRKIAFVCSGGAAKAGAFHLGVALALQEQGFLFKGGIRGAEGANPPSREGQLGRAASSHPQAKHPLEISTYVGSSAGSIITSYLAAGYSLDNIFNSFLGRISENPLDNIPRALPKLTYPKMLRLNPGLAREQFRQALGVKKLAADLIKGDWESFVEFKWLKATGLFTTAGIEQYMREDVLESNRFQDYLAEFFIVATKLNHSRKTVFGKYQFAPPPHDLTCQYDNNASISEAVAASAALPPIFAPYQVRDANGEDHHYVDGEIRDTLSTHVAIDAGADLVFASYTHQPYHYTAKVGSLTEYGLPAILVQSIYLLIEQKINNHIHNKEVQRNAIDAVDKFCKDENILPAQHKKIIEILEAELHHRREVDTIYIHPSPEDSGFFFSEHFSLSTKGMSATVRSGFRAAIEILKKYKFEGQTTDRPNAVSVD